MGDESVTDGPVLGETDQGEKRDILIISHRHLPPENVSMRTKTNTYASIYGELHRHTLGAQFGFSRRSRCGE